MTSSHTSSAALVETAEKLAPLLKAKAREAEIARRPLDEVIDAVRDSGLFSLMVPRVYGGHEADLDAFFDVVVTLSRADASMGWLIGFYIEHNFWFCSYPRSFQEELYADREYVLAPGALNFSAGAATKVKGGYRLSGRWQWGTGIVHGSWVLAGAAVQSEDGTPVPFFFALPREQTETIDNWYVSGMCGTGSWDFRIDDVFVPEERGVPVFDLFSNAAEGAKIHEAPLYRTPLAPILGFAAGLPCLGAAQMALEEYRAQTKEKIEKNHQRAGGLLDNEGKPSVAARAALTIEAAELMLRGVLTDVMAKRNTATMDTRSAWQTRIAHAVFMCREATQDICSVTGASGSRLENPMQRALRDIDTASNHVFFDREARYADFGRLLLDQPIRYLLV